jgi:hypothetical protein
MRFDERIAGMIEAVLTSKAYEKAVLYFVLVVVGWFLGHLHAYLQRANF